MSNPFSHMNRAQRRKFDGLPVEQKAEAIQAAVMENAKKPMADAISRAMIHGMALAGERIYQEYVTRIDSAEITQDERGKEIDNLLSFLRVAHLKHRQGVGMGAEEGNT